MKRVWKPTKEKHIGPIEPDRTLLEMAVARELLTTWEITKNRQLIESHLQAVDKVYGKDAQIRIRQYMRQIKQNER